MAGRPMMLGIFDGFVPQGIPNLHAGVIHFPIGILVVTVMADWVVVLMNQPTWRPGVSGGYALGTLMLAGAYLSGRFAATEVFVPGMAHGLVNEHWTLGFWALIYFTVLSIAYSFDAWIPQVTFFLFRPALLLAGVIGLVLLVVVADHGARLVYEYGVGVIGGGV